ncbi:sensor histidine kinase [Pseudohongiella spirulinae]|uniref:histidine kinase n=1 Tax=Pseudohongiella spirulinae TaxID=1249552 RepID=A0A0S2KCC7_9GAMM|nr:PAS domain S-box protein [Pseudohongiella spirulinae]ALO45764.1 histidine kinase [Pseudohongiella spirulinae]
MAKANHSERLDNDELMHFAIEAAPNGMVIVDDSGQIVRANSSVETLFGYQRDELLGQPIEQLVPARFSQAHPKLRARYVVNPQARAMGHGRDLYGLHKDGSEIPVEIGLNPITIGERVFIFATIVDITERQRAQEMVHLAVEAAPNGMIMTDKEGKITLVNSMIETMFGYSREELIGANVDILVPVRFREDHPGVRHTYTQQPVSRAMGKGRDLYALNRHGEEFPVEIGLNPLRTANGVMILASVVDITERKQQEESLRSALLAKETLLAEIHHRVKNNLQVIDSLIGMQMDQVAGEQARAALMESQNRVKTISLIHQILYQSQDFAQIDAKELITSLTHNLAQSYGMDRDRIDLQLDLDPLLLSMNRSLPLGLIVNELVTNALKHAFPGNRSGTLTVTLKRSGYSRAVLAVTDTGIGLPADKVTSESASLGLRLMHALTAQIEAELDVTSRNPTRFALSFDLERLTN